MITSPGGRIDILVEPDLRGFDGKLGSGLRSATGVAGTIGKGLGLAIAAGVGVAAVGFKEVIDLGITYEQQLNTLQAVTGATGEEMARVGQAATELGSDLSLPATSAADAAAAMLELAKGGLTVDEAMAAARGTLQLAAAAQIDAAQAAEIQSAALNQFGLSADQAGRVADVLANTANAAAGEITDMGLALKYVGPIAASLGISIEDTAAAVGLLANNGILGENAGTALRGVLASLAAPSKEAEKALTELGIAAFDQEGRFVGYRAVIEQLTAAKGRLTDAEFANAAATAFGREPLAAITALASEGAPAFDAMATAVGRQGGAADVAAAKTKGLGGAIEGLKSQTETVALKFYELINGPLETLTRAGAEKVELWGNAAVDALAGVRVESGDMSGALDVARDVLDSLVGAGEHVVDTLRPMASGLAEVVSSSTQAGGAVQLAGDGFGLAGDAVEVFTATLEPVGDLLGVVLGIFARLPGPVQAAVAALIAFRLVRERLADTALLSGFRQFGQEMRVQRDLAAAAGSTFQETGGTLRQLANDASGTARPLATTGQALGLLEAVQAAYRTSTVGAVAATREFTDQVSAIKAGAAGAGAPVGALAATMGALSERVGVLGDMGRAFSGAAEGATRFGTAAGVAAAAGVGLRSAASGLLAALGGPWGLVIGGAVAGLGLLSAAQQRSAEAAARHEQYVTTLSDALRESGGVINQNVREHAFLALEQVGAVNSAKELGVALNDVTSAALGQAPALEQLRTKLQAIIDAGSSKLISPASGFDFSSDQAKAARALLDAINEQAAATEEARQRLRDVAAAMGVTTGDAARLSEAVGILTNEFSSADDKARALSDALDALSGGQLSYEEAVGRLNEQVGRLGEAFGKARDGASGAGVALLDASGGINTSTEAGLALLDTTRSLTQAMAESVTQVYEKTLAEQGAAAATTAATAEAQRARDAFVAAAQAAGLNAEQANQLADRYGLIPSQVLTLIDAPGAPEVIAEVAQIDKQLRGLPPNTPVYVDGLTQEAQARLESIGYTVTHMPNGQVRVVADVSAAQNAIDNFVTRNDGRVIQTYTVNNVTRRTANQAELAAGGIVAAAYAEGGIHRKLRPMKAGMAQIVPPNTWRVVGDRLVDDELYLPINRSTRSVALLHTAADRMGYALARKFAEGAIANRSTGVPLSSRSLSAVNNITVFAQSASAESVAASVDRHLAFLLR